jgi:hypothetical protein
MTADLRSAAQVVGLLRGQVTELLGRALEVVESAYACSRRGCAMGGPNAPTRRGRCCSTQSYPRLPKEVQTKCRSPSLVRAPSRYDGFVSLPGSMRKWLRRQRIGLGTRGESAAGAGSPAALYTIQQLVYNDLACNPRREKFLPKLVKLRRHLENVTATISYYLRQLPNTESSLTAINNRREQPLCCFSR